MDQLATIQLVLKQFCSCSGHKFMAVEDLGRYLGVALLHQRVSYGTYSYLVQKVRDRLAGWRAKTLSFARRVVMAKAVLSVLPSTTSGQENTQTERVANMVTSWGEWNWREFQSKLPMEVLFCAVKPPLPHGGEDRPGWLWEHHRKCSVSSAYKHIVQSSSIRDVWRLGWCGMGSLDRRINGWELLFGSIIWCLWIRRNNRIFSPEISGSESVFHQAMRLVTEEEEARKLFITRTSLTRPLRRDIRWQPPNLGWYKANTDGARDSMTVPEAELWGVLDGLLSAWDCGLREVIVELNNRDAWHLLHAREIAVSSLSELLTTPVIAPNSARCGHNHGCDCGLKPYSLVPHLVECMARSSRLQFVHVVREGNQAADHMAKLAWGWQYGCGWKVSTTSPTEVLAIVFNIAMTDQDSVITMIFPALDTRIDLDTRFKLIDSFLTSLDSNLRFVGGLSVVSSLFVIRLPM
ncbi:hypothetical protein F3Y22_tig00117001pilonHSYRG00018 [Hibiscus syriacus]|uniref:RNase H type-1 domain-containing protein n=1 Tax=Hibiscus syriacus TaxID=106335 RepID=A0A6A2XD91_HIBSY|nr:hypothetical protein F3Y22_tig00117001pilonHSYRG00018 [Hibiscus syriacus]